MAIQVTPMPGTGCLYYIQGQCIHKMKQNPTFHDEWRCLIVEQWEQAFDEYLAQVDRFDIDQDTAMKIWSRRFSKLVGRPKCPDFVPGDDPVVGCAKLHFDLCVTKIPSCPGRCKHYCQEV